uniref:Uncharacterized protein n=1 Tax=Arundo donax TaxID=35708 RepID=A0A0A8Z4D1_ARUDO
MPFFSTTASLSVVLKLITCFECSLFPPLLRPLYFLLRLVRCRTFLSHQIGSTFGIVTSLGFPTS